MIKHKKLRRGKGKRIKEQWQYRLLELIQAIINFPERARRIFKYYRLTFIRWIDSIEIERQEYLISEEEARERALLIANDMLFNRHFIM